MPAPPPPPGPVKSLVGGHLPAAPVLSLLPMATGSDVRMALLRVSKEVTRARKACAMCNEEAEEKATGEEQQRSCQVSLSRHIALPSEASLRYVVIDGSSTPLFFPLFRERDPSPLWAWWPDLTWPDNTRFWIAKKTAKKLPMGWQTDEMTDRVK